MQATVYGGSGYSFLQGSYLDMNVASTQFVTGRVGFPVLDTNNQITVNNI